MLLKKTNKGLSSILIVFICLNLFATLALNGICGCGEGCVHCEILANKYAGESKTISHAGECCAVPTYDSHILAADSGSCQSVDISIPFLINVKQQSYNISTVADFTSHKPSNGHFQDYGPLNNFLKPTARTSPIYLFTQSFIC